MMTTNGQLMTVRTQQGPPLLLMLSPQTRPNAGLHSDTYLWAEGVWTVLADRHPGTHAAYTGWPCRARICILCSALLDSFDCAAPDEALVELVSANLFVLQPR
jgi:hypothetical protein